MSQSPMAQPGNSSGPTMSFAGVLSDPPVDEKKQALLNRLDADLAQMDPFEADWPVPGQRLAQAPASALPAPAKPKSISKDPRIRVVISPKLAKPEPAAPPAEKAPSAAPEPLEAEPTKPLRVPRCPVMQAAQPTSKLKRNIPLAVIERSLGLHDPAPTREKDAFAPLNQAPVSASGRFPSPALFAEVPAAAPEPKLHLVSDVRPVFEDLSEGKNPGTLSLEGLHLSAMDRLVVNQNDPQDQAGSLLEVHVQVAGFGRRALASVVDVLVLFALFATYLSLGLWAYGSKNLVVSSEKGLDFWVDMALRYSSLVVPGLVLLAGIGFLYDFTLHSLMGKTLGKMLAGIKVVREDGTALSSVHVLGRALTTVLSAALGLGGFWWAAFDGKRQTWHDKAAGTLVVLDQ